MTAPTSAEPTRANRRARQAVSALFFINGLTYTNVVPWLPTIKAKLELSNTELGLAIAAMPLGAILIGMLAGPLIHRFGSGPVAVWSALGAIAALPFVSIAGNWWALAAALFVLGWADAWTDAAQNAHGLRVQRRYGRTIINTFHAAWSIAAVCGGLLGAAMAGSGVPIQAHLSTMAVVLAVGTLFARRFLLTGPEDHAQAADDEDPTRGELSRGRLIARKSFIVLALGVMLMLAAGIEDSAASWGAVYMTSELDASAFVAALPFVACQGLMTVGRLFGDRVTDRFGPAAIGRYGGLTIALGLGAALIISQPVATVIGFGLMGLGVSTLFPLTLAAAGSIDGVRPGTGIAVVGWLGRAGFLSFPPVVGAVADQTSLGSALWIVAGGGAIVFLLAPVLRLSR